MSNIQNTEQHEDLASAIGGCIDRMKAENAALRASNLQLLAALKNCVQSEFGDKGLRDPNHDIGWVRFANRAIAKAEARG
jgi:hypothetical protein